MRAKDNPNYFDIFPDAKLSIKARAEKRILAGLDPASVRQFVLSLFRAGNFADWVTISHPALINRVFLIYLDGLDISRFNKFRDSLPSLVSISSDGFPVQVHAKERKGYLIPANYSLLGLPPPPQIRPPFKSYAEMVEPIQKLEDNGFPLPVDHSAKPSKKKLRCEFFNLPQLSESQLAACRKLPDTIPSSLPIISIDCEMIETENGDEVARLSAVDENLVELLDETYKPLGAIKDLRTKVSGITEEILANAKKTSDKALDDLSRFADSSTIIVGHSLENDFRALKLIHQKVIDTSLIFDSETPYPRKPSLALLYSKYIQKPFRTTIGGHNSTEDASAAMELAKYALGRQLESKIPPQVPEFFSLALSRTPFCKVLSYPKFSAFCGLDDRIKCNIFEDEANRAEELSKCVEKGSEELVIGFFQALSECESEGEADAIKIYESAIRNAIDKMRSGGVLIVYGGCGSLKRLKGPGDNEDPPLAPGFDPLRRAEFEICKQGLLWVHCSQKGKE